MNKSTPSCPNCHTDEDVIYENDIDLWVCTNCETSFEEEYEPPQDTQDDDGEDE